MKEGKTRRKKMNQRAVRVVRFLTRLTRKKNLPKVAGVSHDTRTKEKQRALMLMQHDE